MKVPKTDSPEANGPAGRGPSPETPLLPDGPRRWALRSARLAWAAALVLQAMNLGFELTVGPSATIGWPLRPAVLALLVLLMAVVFAHSARLQAYKRGWRGRVVTPPAYLRGNLLMLAALTLAVCLILASAPFTGADRGIVRMLGLAATLATALNWPHGRPMQPTGS